MTTWNTSSRKFIQTIRLVSDRMFTILWINTKKCYHTIVLNWADVEHVMEQYDVYVNEKDQSVYN